MNNEIIYSHNILNTTSFTKNDLIFLRRLCYKRLVEKLIENSAFSSDNILYKLIPKLVEYKNCTNENDYQLHL